MTSLQTLCVAGILCSQGHFKGRAEGRGLPLKRLDPCALQTQCNMVSLRCAMFAVVTSLCLAFSRADIEFDCKAPVTNCTWPTVHFVRLRNTLF